jgi:hypothetical protein
VAENKTSSLVERDISVGGGGEFESLPSKHVSGNIHNQKLLLAPSTTTYEFDQILKFSSDIYLHMRCR